MTSRAITPLHGGEFDRFLFASIGDETNGMSLSVVSALARLGIDPWEETLALSRLPRAGAAARLAGRIASSTNSLSLETSSETIAARLVALLPASPSFAARAPEAASALVSVRPSRLTLTLGLVALLLAGYVFYIFQRTSSAPTATDAVTTDTTNPR